MYEPKITNRLLFVIAACLTALVGKQFVASVIPEAKAAPLDGPQAVRLYGCSLPYQNATYPSQCDYKIVRVDDRGVLLVKNQ